MLVCGSSIPAHPKEPPRILWQLAGATAYDSVYTEPAPPQKLYGLKSENKAFKLSLYSTLAPAGVAWVGVTLPLIIVDGVSGTSHIASLAIGGGAGILFGPSVGYFYAGRGGRGMQGILIRIGTGAATGLVAIAVGTRGDDYGRNIPFFIGVISLGGGLLMADAIYDIVKVKDVVRKQSETLQKTGWLLTPKYFVNHKAGGMELHITF